MHDINKVPLHISDWVTTSVGRGMIQSIVSHNHNQKCGATVRIVLENGRTKEVKLLDVEARFSPTK
jgi:hypothetical protein